MWLSVLPILKAASKSTLFAGKCGTGRNKWTEKIWEGGRMHSAHWRKRHRRRGEGRERKARKGQRKGEERERERESCIDFNHVGPMRWKNSKAFGYMAMKAQWTLRGDKAQSSTCIEDMFTGL
jgi:hypothetical protein